jgi:uncharacterized protein (DUF697 family)
VQDALEHARNWIDADAPVLWLLGKTQAGKTSIVAEMTGQGHDEVGRGYQPMTRETRIYGFPPEHPVLRFLDTRGLAECADGDSGTELAQAREQAHLLLVVVRVDDLDISEIIDAVDHARGRHRKLPVMVAQTGLHRCYGDHERHIEPYPFDGSAEDARRPGVPHQLSRVMMAQRKLFDRIPGPPPLFVPLDFTRPEQGVAPTDYGAERLWDMLEETLPKVSDGLRTNTALPNAIRAKVILPWAMTAAAANAVPLPVLGGLGSASLQAGMVTLIAHRLGFSTNRDLWREFCGTLGAGFGLAYGGSWLVQQVLKAGVGLGTAIVASWTFAITWAIGEAALYYFGEKAAGREPDREKLQAIYHEALRDARDRYKTQKRDGKDR